MRKIIITFCLVFLVAACPGMTVAAGGNDAQFEGKLLKIRKGCLAAEGKQEGVLGLWFNNQEDGLIVDSDTPAFKDCMCYGNPPAYCQFTVANITKKRIKTLQGRMEDSYDGIGKIINYKKLN